MQTKNALNTTLLIGNGLNRCLEHSISWGDLLAEIADKYGVNYNGNIPMPLEFESIVNQILRNQTDPSTGIYTEIKKAVAEKVRNRVNEKAQKEQIHYMLSNANVIVEKYTIGENCSSYEDGYLRMIKSIKHKS